MNCYDEDYTDDIYDRYMLTGEGAEYFEAPSEEEYIEKSYTRRPAVQNLEDRLDAIIRHLEKEIEKKQRQQNTSNSPSEK